MAFPQFPVPYYQYFHIIQTTTIPFPTRINKIKSSYNFSHPTARLIHIHVKAVERLNEIGQCGLIPVEHRGVRLTYCFITDKIYIS